MIYILGPACHTTEKGNLCKFRSFPFFDYNFIAKFVIDDLDSCRQSLLSKSCILLINGNEYFVYRILRTQFIRLENGTRWRFWWSVRSDRGTFWKSYSGTLIYYFNVGLLIYSPGNISKLQINGNKFQSQKCIRNQFGKIPTKPICKNCFTC